MITIVRDRDGNIKTFGDFTAEMYNQSLGESIETVPDSIEEYGKRLQLSVEGFIGQHFVCHVFDVDLIVNIKSSLPLSSIDLDINGLIDTVGLVQGVGSIILSVETPGMYIIQPADRKTFCAAGQGLLVVEVLPNE